MTDQAKRKTLKMLGATAGAGLVTGVSASAAAAAFTTSNPDGLSHGNASAAVSVQTRLSALHNDLEVVLTNESTSPITISSMTPSYTVVARGQFDFSRLLKHGDLTLAPGESISVPLERQPVQINTPNMRSLPASSISLADALKKSMSIRMADSQMATLSVSSALAVA